MVTWELRYRAPRTVETVRIQTFTSNPEEAKAVADAYLATLSSPSIRFIYVKPDVVATTADFPEIAKKFGPLKGLVTPADMTDAEQPESPSAVEHVRAKPGLKAKPAERVGA